MMDRTLDRTLDIFAVMWNSYTDPSFSSIGEHGWRCGEAGRPEDRGGRLVYQESNVDNERGGE